MRNLEQDVGQSRPFGSATPIDIAAFWRLLLRWHMRVTQRAHLAQLDMRLLDDIGVTPEQAEAQINKPFWL